MRRQDELIALYPGQDPLTRKYILYQAEALSLAFDSEELFEFLLSQVRDPDPIVRNQCQFSLARFLPGYVRRRLGLSSHSRGIWTNYADRKHGWEDRLAAVEDPERANARLRAFVHLVRDVGAGLVARRDGAATSHEILSGLLLGRLPLRTVHRALRGTLSGGGFEAALIHASTRDPADGVGEISRLIREHAQDQPDLCLLLSTFPEGGAARDALDLIPITNVQGRLNLAQILPGLRGIDHREVLAALGKFREGWVTVYSLRAMEALGDPDYFPVIRGAYERSPHNFVQTQAIRAAGGIECPASLEFCLHAARTGRPSIQAQAIESLVRLRCDPDTLRDAATPLLRSRSLRARVNAVLATAPRGEEILPDLRELLMADETMLRLEGAYCLGYLQNSRSLDYLEIFIQLDPSLNVKLQAIKSLSKYPAEASIPRLVPRLHDANPVVAITAARCLARYEGDEARVVTEALVDCLEPGGSKLERALIHRTIGILGARQAVPAVESLLDAGLEAEEGQTLAGAVEGWIHLGGASLEARREPLRKARGAADARASVRARMALVLAGDLEALGELGRIALGSTPEAAAAALQSLLELALIAGAEELGARYPALEASLQSVAARSACREDGDISLPGTVETRLAGAPSTGPGPLPGRFPVRRDIRTSPAAPLETGHGSPAGQPRATQGIGLLAVHLNSPRVQAEAGSGKFSRKLRKVTYLVDEGFSTGLLARLRENPVLLVPVAATALLLVTFMVAAAARSSVRSPAPLPALSIDYFEGKVLGPGGRPIVLGMELESGSVISTGPEQSVRLITKQGNTLSLFGSSSISVKNLADDGSELEVLLSPGLYAFSFVNPGLVRAGIESHRITGRNARFSIGPWKDLIKLVVESGTVQVEPASGGGEAVGPGSPFILE